jgi:uncharacterized protein
MTLEVELKISGEYTMHAPKQAVWDKLVDPNAIAACLPGVEKLEKTGENEYSMSMNLDVGPVKGTLTGTVHLSNLNPPDSYQMSVVGNSPVGRATANGNVQLSPGPDNTTTVTYSGDMGISGPAGFVAQRVLGSQSKTIANRFFGCIERQIQGS